MSFTDEVKSQLYKAEIRNACCAGAELFGILCNKPGRIAGAPAFIKRVLYWPQSRFCPPSVWRRFFPKRRRKKEAFVTFQKPALLPTAF